MHASEYATLVAQEYDRLLDHDAQDLVKMTPDQLLLKIFNVARLALSNVRKTHGTSALTGVDLNQIEPIAAAAFNDKAQSALNVAIQQGQFAAPTDVSCSMAILSWQETGDTCGRRVANEYIGIQVTVRNLDKANEFLIHDIQVAVDTGLDFNSFSRFQAGRDKLLVRSVAQRGSSEDRRNLALHSLEAVGAIAGSSSIIGYETLRLPLQFFRAPSYLPTALFSRIIRWSS